MGETVSAFDAIAVGIVLMSALMGFSRGFLREFATLGAFIAALIAAFLARRYLRDWLAGILPDGLHPLLPDAILVVGAFLVIYITVSILGQSLSRSIHSTGEIGLVDHITGAIFGILRGIVALVFFAVLIGMAFDNEQMPRFIQNSFSFPYLSKAARVVMPAPDTSRTPAPADATG